MYLGWLWPNVDRCSGASYCAHTEMPLYSQADPALISYINQVAGLHLTADPGWCVPTSVSMLEKSISNRLSAITNNTTVGNVSALNEYQLIYKTMKQLGTNISGGATPWANSVQGFYNFLASAQSYPYSMIALDAFGNLAAEFNLHKSYISIGVVNTDPNFFNGYSPSGHNLALNGVDNGHLKIFDPWGRIYTVQQSGNSLVAPSGYGYVQWSNSSGKTVQIYALSGGFLAKHL